jgi:hypothetical protein
MARQNLNYRIEEQLAVLVEVGLIGHAPFGVLRVPEIDRFDPKRTGIVKDGRDKVLRLRRPLPKSATPPRHVDADTQCALMLNHF